jgi:hypothetical protein
MRFRFTLSFLVFLFFSIGQIPSLGEEISPPSLIEQYQADLSLLSRHVSISGDSDEALKRHRELFDSWLARVAAVDFEAFARDEQVDMILLRNEIEAAALKLEERVGKREDLSSWLPFREGIDALGDARVRGEAMNPEEAAAVLAPVAESVSELQKSLKAARGKADKPDEEDPELKTVAGVELPTPHQALMASEAVDDLAARLKQWFENYNGFIPEFSWWVKKPHDEAAKALTDYAKYLREEIAGVKDPKKEGGAGGAPEDEPLLGKAIGPSMLQRHLDHEMIPYTPEELIAMAEREFAWCEEQMREASREMKLGEDWKEAMEQVKLAHVPPGEQETFVKSEARRAIDFLKERKLVTIPPNCELWWGTRMLSLSAQRNMPYAAYSGHDVLIAYANDAMSHEDKIMSMRGNNRHFTRNVVPHELIPGHHLQSYMSARQRPYRRVFSTPFFVEGWALYWEMRLYDLKYQTTPEDRIGALFWRMHRCARIIVTLKFHLGEMTPDEMVTFLTDRVGHEKFGATSEVRRFIKGNYSPLYQCGYMLGGLQLIALHSELVEAGKMTDLEFHDSVLTLGPIPIEMVRASLLEQPLTADFKTEWRFGETVPVR